MSAVSVSLPAPPERAFLVLEDPRTIRSLVVGARRVRRFDPRWPEAGTAVHHSAGAFPFVIRDTTVVVECVRDCRLVLEARLGWIGAFLVTFELSPEDGGSLLSVDETVLNGIFKAKPLRLLAHLLLGLRNAELCRRFRKLVEAREQLAARIRHG